MRLLADIIAINCANMVAIEAAELEIWQNKCTTTLLGHPVDNIEGAMQKGHKSSFLQNLHCKKKYVFLSVVTKKW